MLEHGCDAGMSIVVLQLAFIRVSRLVRSGWSHCMCIAFVRIRAEVTTQAHYLICRSLMDHLTKSYRLI